MPDGPRKLGAVTKLERMLVELKYQAGSAANNPQMQAQPVLSAQNRSQDMYNEAGEADPIEQQHRNYANTRHNVSHR